MPFKFDLDINYYVEQPDAFGPEWMVGFNIFPIVPNFIERWVKEIFQLVGQPPSDKQHILKEFKNVDSRAKAVEGWRLSLVCSSTFKGISEVFGMGLPGVLELKKGVQNIRLPATRARMWGDEKAEPSNDSGEST